MKRFNIHWSLRWTLRVIYGIVILSLAGYLGIGYFLHSHLANDLLVKQLSDRTGRTVLVKRVSMDWFRGFHLVLEDVTIPAEDGGSPWVSCRKLVATLKIWPFLSRKEIIFSRLSVEDGHLRLVKEKNGTWRGAFPGPIPPSGKVGEAQELRSASGKEAGGFTFLLPHVLLKRVAVEVFFKTSGGNKRVRLFIDQGRTMIRKKEIKGEFEGNFNLNAGTTPAEFHTRFHYTLSKSFPMEATLWVTNLSLKDLASVWGNSPLRGLEGTADLSLDAAGEIRKDFTIGGTLVVRKTGFERRDWRFVSDGGPLRLRIAGGWKRAEPGGRTPYLEVKTNPLRLRIQQRRHGGSRTLHLAFRALAFRGDYRPSLKKATFSLASHSEAKNGDAAGGLTARGAFDLGGARAFDIAFSYARFPLRQVLLFLRKGRGGPVVEAEIPRHSWRVLDVVEGKARGDFADGTVKVQSAALTIRKRDSRLHILVAPFTPPGAAPVRLDVTCENLPVSLARDNPRFLERVPTEYRTWCQAFRAGILRAARGEITVERDGEGRPSGLKIHRASLKGTEISVVMPGTGMAIDNLSLDVTYRAPCLRVKELQCDLDGDNCLKFQSLEIRDVYKKPLTLKGSAMFQSAGLNLKGGAVLSPLARFITSKLPKRLPFVPKYFEGKISALFDGTLFPFSYKTYAVSIEKVRVKALTKATNHVPAMPITILVSGSAEPGSTQIEKASMVTPLGGMTLGGTITTDATGVTTVDITSQGEVIANGNEFQGYSPRLKPLRVTGTAPFSLRLQGTWPRIFLQGHLGLTGMTLGYRDLFLKDKGLPSFVDFHVAQTGKTSCKVSWIRGKFGQFVIKLWGDLTSFSPLIGKIRCQTDTRQFRALLPLFPRLCKDRHCLMAKGDIQCDGIFAFGEPFTYHLSAEVNNATVPFPKSREPFKISRLKFLLANGVRSVDIDGFLYKGTIGNRFSLAAISREGQWFWRGRADFKYLDLDDFRPFYWPRHRMEKDGVAVRAEAPAEKEKQVGLFVKLARFLHGKFIRGAISAKGLKVLDYRLQDFFTRFDHQGTHGRIRGLNFLTPEGYGAIDVDWSEMDKGDILLKVDPIAKNLDFGKILTGLLGRDSPFTGMLSFHGALKGVGQSFHDVRKTVSGYMVAEYKNGVIKHWKVLSDIFALINIYDILKGLPDFSKEGLAYKKIKGTITVKNGIAKTDNARLESRPFFIGGQGQLNLGDGMLTLLIGVYPFKMIDKIISKVPIVGWIFTDHNKRVLGYYFRVEGHVTQPEVSSVNIESYGKNIFNIFKKIITLPIYPFLDHSKKEEKK